jgi:hypothetical protein
MSAEMTAQRLRKMEHERLAALVAAKVSVAERLHADDYELITPSGSTISKREYLDGIASGALRYSLFEPVSEIRVRVYQDAAILRYRVRIEIAFSGGTDGGEFWHTDVYERREGSWQAVWSQATRTAARG